MPPVILYGISALSKANSISGKRVRLRMRMAMSPYWIGRGFSPSPGPSKSFHLSRPSDGCVPQSIHFSSTGGCESSSICSFEPISSSTSPGLIDDSSLDQRLIIDFKLISSFHERFKNRIDKANEMSQKTEIFGQMEFAALL